MNTSAADVVLVPSAVVTVTSTVLAAPAGAVAVIWVGPFTVYAAGVEPKVTPVAPVKLVPVMVTDVPPVVEPEVGETPVTEGGRRDEGELVGRGVDGRGSRGVVTVTSTVARRLGRGGGGDRRGAVHGDPGAAVVPNLTPVAPVRLVPGDDDRGAAGGGPRVRG